MGLVLEAATEHVEVMAVGTDGEELALETEEVGHGHTQRLTPLVARALERSGLAPRPIRSRRVVRDERRRRPQS